MNAIYGLFPDANSARRALTALRAACSRFHLNPKAIVIMSSEPLDEEGFGWEEERTLMPWLAPLGALVGAGVGYALSAFTQRSYPLPTGGMVIAVETTDECVGKLLKVIEEINGIALITADHGNADEMYTMEKGKKVPKTSHTLNPVPF